MPVEHVPAGGFAGSLHPPVDFPRTLVNAGALAALVALGIATLVRILSGGPMLPALVYESLAGIEILWLVGQAILVSSQD
jgi:hypothetical protein